MQAWRWRRRCSPWWAASTCMAMAPCARSLCGEAREHAALRRLIRDGVGAPQPRTGVCALRRRLADMRTRRRKGASNGLLVGAECGLAEGGTGSDSAKPTHPVCQSGAQLTVRGCRRLLWDKGGLWPTLPDKVRSERSFSNKGPKCGPLLTHVTKVGNLDLWSAKGDNLSLFRLERSVDRTALELAPATCLAPDNLQKRAGGS